MLLEDKDRVLFVVTSGFLHHSPHLLVDRQMLVAFVFSGMRTYSGLYSVCVTVTSCLINILMTAWDSRHSRDKSAPTPPLNFTNGKLQIHNQLIYILVFLYAWRNVVHGGYVFSVISINKGQHIFTIDTALYLYTFKLHALFLFVNLKLRCMVLRRCLNFSKFLTKF